MVIVFVIFGSGKIPQVGEGLGKGIRNFRSSMKEASKDIEGPAPSGEEEAKSEEGG
jgi:sec-independent protein translocase protein TatA